MARTKASPHKRRPERNGSKSRSVSRKKTKDTRSLNQKACDCVRKVRTSFVVRSLSRVLDESKPKARKALATGKRSLFSKEKRRNLMSAPYGICTKSVYGSRSRKGPGRYNCKDYDKSRWTLEALRALLFVKDKPYKEEDSKATLLKKLEE